jgi:hypothetical protein
MKLGDTLKTVAIVGVVAVISFFVAQAIIPERKLAAQGESVPEESLRKSAAAVVDDEEIPVVTVDHVPVETPIEVPANAGSGVDAGSLTESTPPIQVISVQIPPAQIPSTQTPSVQTQALATQKPEAIKPDTAIPQKSIAPTPAVRHSEAQPNLKIEKSALCASIENREPQGISDRFSKNSKQIYYFTHVTGARDTAVIMHRWYHEGKLFQNSILRINSPSWRTHSRRSLINIDEMVGNWRVEAVEQTSGRVLDEAAFVIE